MPDATSDPAPPAETPRGVPWETRFSDDPPGAAWDTWRRSVFRPTPFFRDLPARGGLLAPLGFLLLFTLLGALFSAVWTLTFGTAPFLPGQADVSPAVGALISFVIAPFTALLIVFVGGAIVHLCLLLVGGGAGGYRATVRALCFTAGPNVFALVPFLGGLVATIWSVVLCVIGLREVHRTELWRSVFGVFAPFVLLVAFVLLVGVLVVLFGLVAL